MSTTKHNNIEQRYFDLPTVASAGGWVSRTTSAFHKVCDFMGKPHREQIASLRSRVTLACEDVGWSIPHTGKDRTAYVIGLFGSGRWYVTQMISQNIGRRAKYVRYKIRFHPSPTSLIYTGHATIKHVSRGQQPPAVTSCILEAVRSGFADLIFIYRHPLDSLLTNWICWRTYIRGNRMVPGISLIYKKREDLCADLEQNFVEFKSFAEGRADFFATLPGPRFLSFEEFVEETELYLQAATLALRLEDFSVDPMKEFSKIADVMSVDLELSRLNLTSPTTTPYSYLEVKEKVSPFRHFIRRLGDDTKRRIESIGYGTSA